jgi:hypothetical protein
MHHLSYLQLIRIEIFMINDDLIERKHKSYVVQRMTHQIKAL